MASKSSGHGFGTSPVFLAAISTILGAILFLRFGYAVGNVGMGGVVLLVLIGHAITIPTGLAVAEIATNLKVEGGGEYYIISRSFGTTVGGAIGIALYFSQAISVAFYLIAFAEAFRPLFSTVYENWGFMPDVRMISIPAAIIVLALIMLKGAGLGVNALWVVVAILVASLVMFFLGSPTANTPAEVGLFSRVEDSDDFFKVFAIIFPAFTGMTAGVGLSGDLKNPRKSIPLGTLAATLVGMAVYILIAVKLSYSASPEELADVTSSDLIMSKIAVWGPIIPIGLAAATISSTLGSILVAPRTLQALAHDSILPSKNWNRFLARGKGEANEPVNATLLTALIVFVFVSLGNVDFVAQIISMFFMITYGALCSISFLEHFAGNPSYRPTFRTKWYLSLVGAVAAFIMMFQMQPLYALFAMITMALIYTALRRTRKGERDLSGVIKGVLFQMTRNLQVTIQKKEATPDVTNWRPSFIALTPNSMDRVAAFDMLRWISHYYGFGSYIHFIKGPLDRESNKASAETLKKLIEQVQASAAGIYVDTIISPSFRTAVAQIVQIPGIAGMENNGILFEFEKDDPDDLEEIIDGCEFASAVDFNICILRSSDRHFGYHKNIHIWLRPGDYRNANLMIILAYILIGHPQWKKCEIKLLSTFHPAEVERETERLNSLIKEGRIPISRYNIQKVPFDGSVPFEQIVTEHSSSADLVITGLSLHKMRQDRGKFLKEFEGVHDMLFVRAGQDILITYSEEIEIEEPEEIEEEENPGEKTEEVDKTEQKE